MILKITKQRTILRTTKQVSGLKIFFEINRCVRIGTLIDAVGNVCSIEDVEAVLELFNVDEDDVSVSSLARKNNNSFKQQIEYWCFTQRLLKIRRMIDHLDICRNNERTRCIFWTDRCITFERCLSDNPWWWRIQLEKHRTKTSIDDFREKFTSECDSCNRARLLGDLILSNSESWSALNRRFFVDDWGWTTRGCIIILSFWSSSMVQFRLSSSSSSSSSSSESNSSLREICHRKDYISLEQFISNR